MEGGDDDEEEKGGRGGSANSDTGSRFHFDDSSWHPPQALCSEWKESILKKNFIVRIK
jgi:hypothetical protein